MGCTPSQSELLAFLLDPASYPHRPKRTELIQTHAAYVVLASPYAYKVKKPVNFGFLDYSSLEQRREVTAQEVVLNRRLCPHLYLGVVPIALDHGRLHFGEGGRIVEYAVRMRKLSDRGFLKYRVQQGIASSQDIFRIVETLAPFYMNQKPTTLGVWGRIEKLRINTDENFRQTTGYIGQTVSRPAFEAIRGYTDRFYETQAPLFESRVREGWIVDGHGDLRLDHVHLTPGRVCIFDCIEFNDRFRYLDVASDIAFLAMDLDYNGRPDLAPRFVAGMSEALGDTAMPRLMAFYKCYRAYVRGKVESFRSSEPEVPEEERANNRQRAQRYFRLALQYAVIGSQPTVLAVMGRTGAGKSALAAELASALGWPVFTSDRLRKEIAGLPVHGRSEETIRHKLYGQEMTQRTYQALFEHAERQMETGHSVILDATFGNRRFRDRLKECIAVRDAALYFVEVTASETARKQRLMAREQCPHEISDARPEDMEAIDRAYVPPQELHPACLLSIDTEAPIDATLTHIFTEMVRRHAERS